MFVLRRVASGPSYYVALPGSARSYTRSIDKARRYPTRDAAEADRCPENETIQEVN